MDRMRALRTFIAVAENESFAEAGRRLRMAPTTVTRIVAALEQSLGAPLLVRTTRSVRLTEDGAIFLRRCRAALGEIDEAFEAIRGDARAPHGTLTVTAPVMFGRLHVLPVVIDLLRTHPELQVRLLLLDRVTSVAQDRIDVAVRIGNPPDSALHMVRIGSVRRVFCASPDYIRAHGEPMTIADLRSHAMIDIEDEHGHPGEWQAPKGKGAAQPPRLTVNSIDAALVAAVAGLGIVRTLSYQAAAYIAAGTLIPVVTAEPASDLAVSLLFQSERRDTPNIRAFLAAARANLLTPPASSQ